MATVTVQKISGAIATTDNTDFTDKNSVEFMRENIRTIRGSILVRGLMRHHLLENQSCLIQVEPHLGVHEARRGRLTEATFRDRH